MSSPSPKSDQNPSPIRTGVTQWSHRIGLDIVECRSSLSFNVVVDSMNKQLEHKHCVIFVSSQFISPSTSKRRMSVPISGCRIKVIGCVLSPTLPTIIVIIMAISTDNQRKNCSNDTSNTGLKTFIFWAHVLLQHPSPSVLANLGNNGVHCPPDS